MKRNFLGLMLCGGLALGTLFVVPPVAHADPQSPPSTAKQIASGPDVHTAASMLETEAMQNEQQGHMLGAVAAWRSYARVVTPSDPTWRKAMDHLHELSGLTWTASFKAREVKPLLVGRDLVAIPYKVKYSDTMRNMVTAVDPNTGKVLWTREDAVARPYNGDVAVFVQTWEHIVKVDPKTGGDAWEYRFQMPDGDRVVGPRKDPPDDRMGEGPRKVLGFHGDCVIIQGQTWPVAIDYNTGRVRWGPSPDARPGYRARLTPAGVLTWPGTQRPIGVSEADWRACPMAMLSLDDGHIKWVRPMIGGDPWLVQSGADRIYISDPALNTEVAWTAVSFDRGTTVWREPQAQARPSTLVAGDGVLVVESPDGLDGHTTRFLNPMNGRVMWQSDHITKVTSQGFVLEQAPGTPLTARDIVTGRVMWALSDRDDLHIDAAGALVGQQVVVPAHSPGALSGSDTPGALAADIHTGHVEWHHLAADTPYQQDVHTLATAGDLVLLEQTMQITKPKLADRTPPNTVSSLIALDANRGEVKWGFYDLQTVTSSPPLRVDNSLYVVGNDRDGFTLYSFDLARINQLVRDGHRWWW